MIARLQRMMLLWGALLMAGVWVWGWPQSPWALAAALLGLLALNPLALGLEFMIMVRVNRRDPAPRASWRQLLRAWVTEVRASSRVFGLWQPFQADALGDRLPSDGQCGPRGVLLIHGYFCNRGVWIPWMQHCTAVGRPFMALSLEPPFGSIDAYAAQVERAVTTLTEATGRAPIIVAHSMGGLVVRAWWRACAGSGQAARVHHVITLGTPHQGTWLARWAHTVNGRQMRLASPWLQALAAQEPPGRAAAFSCFYSNCDNIVFPAHTATLPGAQAHFVPGVPHVALATDPGVRARVMALLSALDAQGAA